MQKKAKQKIVLLFFFPNLVIIILKTESKQ